MALSHSSASVGCLEPDRVKPPILITAAGIILLLYIYELTVCFLKKFSAETSDFRLPLTL